MRTTSELYRVNEALELASGFSHPPFQIRGGELIPMDPFLKSPALIFDGVAYNVFEIVELTAKAVLHGKPTFKFDRDRILTELLLGDQKDVCLSLLREIACRVVDAYSHLRLSIEGQSSDLRQSNPSLQPSLKLGNRLAFRSSQYVEKAGKPLPGRDFSLGLRLAIITNAPEKRFVIDYGSRQPDSSCLQLTIENGVVEVSILCGSTQTALSVSSPHPPINELVFKSE